MGACTPRAIVALLLMLVVFVYGYDADDSGVDKYTTFQPVSEKAIDLVHVLNPGEREYLSPNLIGLQNIAMTYIPSTMTFINIIDAYREIVNGVRYEILLNAFTNENKTEIVCNLVIIEKPWLRTFWGDKVRHLRFSNCSLEIENEIDSSTPESNINNQYIENETFNGGRRKELSVDEIRELEAQIYPGDSNLQHKLSINDNTNVYTTTTGITNDRYSNSSPATAMEDSKKDEQYNTLTTTGGYVNEDEDKITADSAATTSVPELSDSEKKWFDEFFLVGANSFETSFNTSIFPTNDSETKDEYGVRNKRSSNTNNANVEHINREMIQVESYLNSSSEKVSPLVDGLTYKPPKVDDAFSNVKEIEGKDNEKDYQENLMKMEDLFLKFRIKYNRRYHTAKEKQLRFRIFKRNLEIIKQLNLNEMGSAKYGVTQFADMTSKEYKQRTGLLQSGDIRNVTLNMMDYMALSNVKLPKEFDWREKGVISKVKNQGNCGSCWAFSVVGNIEGLHSIKTGIDQEYSEQELLDCDTTDKACEGGLPHSAYRSIMEVGGLELESEYPYEARRKQCRLNINKIQVRLKGYVDLPKNETLLAQWLITNGPISVGINANAMQFYRGGVSHPWKLLCSAKSLDHGVLIVGYGISEYPIYNKTLPYWIVKNSWGYKWGEQGYYRVYRGDNTCGISEMASSALLADG